MNAYKKEWVLTLLFFILFLASTHLGILFVLLPVGVKTRLLGFPVHYAIAIIMGWFGITAAVGLYTYFANRLEEEIERREKPGQGDGRAVVREDQEGNDA